MDTYVQVIEFTNYCAGVASMDADTDPAWKHVEQAAKTITPTLERRQMNGVIERSKKQLNKLSNNEIEAIRVKADHMSSALDHKPGNSKSLLRALKASNNPSDKHLSKMINSTSTDLSKLLNKLDAVKSITIKKQLLPKSMEKPEVQAMLKRLDDTLTKEKWDKKIITKVGAAAATIMHAFNDASSRKTLNIKDFISDLNSSKNVHEKLVSKIMNSGAGGFLRSPESPEKFKAKLEAFCDAIELNITTPRTGSMFRP